MEKLKKYWKEILIVILAILFVSNCTGKGNYKRKYEKQMTVNLTMPNSISTAESV